MKSNLFDIDLSALTISSFQRRFLLFSDVLPCVAAKLYSVNFCAFCCILNSRPTCDPIIRLVEKLG